MHLTLQFPPEASARVVAHQLVPIFAHLQLVRVVIKQRKKDFDINRPYGGLKYSVYRDVIDMLDQMLGVKGKLNKGVGSGSERRLEWEWCAETDVSGGKKVFVVKTLKKHVKFE